MAIICKNFVLYAVLNDVTTSHPHYGDLALGVIRDIDRLLFNSVLKVDSSEVRLADVSAHVVQRILGENRMLFFLVSYVSLFHGRNICTICNN